MPQSPMCPLVPSRLLKCRSCSVYLGVVMQQDMLYMSTSKYLQIDALRQTLPTVCFTGHFLQIQQPGMHINLFSLTCDNQHTSDQVQATFRFWLVEYAVPSSGLCYPPCAPSPHMHSHARNQLICLTLHFHYFH